MNTAILDVDDPALRQFTMYYMGLGYALSLTGQAERAVELMEEARQRDLQLGSPAAGGAMAWSDICRRWQV